MRHECPLLKQDLELPLIKTPTFIVHGDCDITVDVVMGEQAAREIPGSKFLKVNGGHHVIPLHKDGDKIF
jgi:pimeloyl-ACP methyl ester carboxylesterase